MSLPRRTPTTALELRRHGLDRLLADREEGQEEARGGAARRAAAPVRRLAGGAGTVPLARPPWPLAALGAALLALHACSSNGEGDGDGGSGGGGAAGGDSGAGSGGLT